MLTHEIQIIPLTHLAVSDKLPIFALDINQDDKLYQTALALNE